MMTFVVTMRTSCARRKLTSSCTASRTSTCCADKAGEEGRAIPATRAQSRPTSGVIAKHHARCDRHRPPTRAGRNSWRTPPRTTVLIQCGQNQHHHNDFAHQITGDRD